MALSSTAKDVGSGIAALYRRYSEWLVSITWKRFFLLSLLLLIVTSVLSHLPPFNWDLATTTTRVPSNRNVDITVDDHGVRIKPKGKRSQGAEVIIDEKGVQIRRRGDAAFGAPSREIIIDEHGVRTRPGPDTPDQTPPTPPKQPGARSSVGDDIQREVVEPLQREVAQAAREEARRHAQEMSHEVKDELATHDLAAEIRREVMDAVSELGQTERVVHIRLGNYLPQLAFLLILLSAAIKIAYAGRVKAEAHAAQAHHVAEEESLKRQVTEAKMAAMQAQVEPHFLFNTA